MNIGGDLARQRAFFGHFARAQPGFVAAPLGFVAAPLGGVQRLLRRRSGLDSGTRRGFAAVGARAKDWLFARVRGAALLPIASGQVPFGDEATGEPLSDHLGYQISYTLPGTMVGTHAS